MLPRDDRELASWCEERGVHRMYLLGLLAAVLLVIVAVAIVVLVLHEFVGPFLRAVTDSGPLND
jgi:hypothetical protein